jgi:rhodanese-related sulfurtransferase
MPMPDPRRLAPGRRALLATLGAAALLGAGTGAWRLVGSPGHAGVVLDPPALASALAEGEVILVDIRRPEEWAQTGIARGAHPLDMRRDDFAEAVAALAGGDRDRPIALICARGVRSARMAARMEAAGFTRILDVPEGMVGSAAGPGWIARGLPVERP